jgi:hypothetical protein
MFLSVTKIAAARIPGGGLQHSLLLILGHSSSQVSSWDQPLQIFKLLRNNKIRMNMKEIHYSTLDLRDFL